MISGFYHGIFVQRMASRSNGQRISKRIPPRRPIDTIKTYPVGDACGKSTTLLDSEYRLPIVICNIRNPKIIDPADNIYCYSVVGNMIT
ncbi:hypothetical protein D3C75_1128240 [compost metagenome]